MTAKGRAANVFLSSEIGRETLEVVVTADGLEAELKRNGTGFSLLMIDATSPGKWGVLPASVLLLRNLRILHASNQNIASLPVDIGLLSRLEELDLSTNKIVAFPPSVGKLSALKALRLQANRLTSIPVEMAQLELLRELNISNNPLLGGLLPSSLARMTQLQKLGIAQTGLTSLESEPGRVSLPASLGTLDISQNNIPVIPTWINTLTNLSLLIVHHNPVADLTPCAFVPSLVHLDSSFTQVKEIPESLCIGLHRLATLQLEGSPVYDLPFHFHQLISLEQLSILAYFLKRSEAHPAPLPVHPIALGPLVRFCAQSSHPLLAASFARIMAHARSETGSLDYARCGAGPLLSAMISYGTNDQRLAALDIVLQLSDSETSRIQLMHTGLIEAIRMCIEDTQRQGEVNAPGANPITAAAASGTGTPGGSRKAAAAGSFAAGVLSTSPPPRTGPLSGKSSGANEAAAAEMRQRTRLRCTVVLSRLCGNATNFGRVLFMLHSGKQAFDAVAKSYESHGVAASSALSQLSHPVLGSGVFTVRVTEIVDLVDGAGQLASAINKPYCHLKVDTAMHSTQVASDYKHPSWANEAWNVNVEDPCARVLEIEVYDYRRLAYDTLLGTATIDLGSAITGPGVASDVVVALTPATVEPIPDPTAPGPAYVAPPYHRARLRVSLAFTPVLPATPGASPASASQSSPALGATGSPAGAAASEPTRRRAKQAASAPSLLEDEWLGSQPTANFMPAIAGRLMARTLGELCSPAHAMGGMDDGLFDDILLSLDCSNAVYYDEPQSFVHQTAFTAAEWSNRQSPHRYLMASRSAPTLPTGAPVNRTAAAPVTYVAFMGTYGAADILTDLAFIGSRGEDGAIHAGFARRAATIPLLPLLNLLRPAGGHVGEPRRLVLCGHSLGGAVAVCVLVRLAVQGALTPEEIRRVRVVTFGQPLVGDSNFAAKLKEMGLSERIHSVVNEGDLVACVLSASPAAAGKRALEKARKLAQGAGVGKLEVPAEVIAAAAPLVNTPREEAAEREQLEEAAADVAKASWGSWLQRGALRGVKSIQNAVTTKLRGKKNVKAVAAAIVGSSAPASAAPPVVAPPRTGDQVIADVAEALSVRLNETFVEYSPVGTYYVLDALSNATSGLIHRLTDPKAIAQHLKVPEGLTSFNANQHLLGIYFKNMDDLRGECPTSALDWVSFVGAALDYASRLARRPPTPHQRLLEGGAKVPQEAEADEEEQAEDAAAAMDAWAEGGVALSTSPKAKRAAEEAVVAAAAVVAEATVAPPAKKAPPAVAIHKRSLSDPEPPSPRLISELLPNLPAATDGSNKRRSLHTASSAGNLHAEAHFEWRDRPTWDTLMSDMKPVRKAAPAATSGSSLSRVTEDDPGLSDWVAVSSDRPGRTVPSRSAPQTGAGGAAATSLPTATPATSSLGVVKNPASAPQPAAGASAAVPALISAAPATPEPATPAGYELRLVAVDRSGATVSFVRPTEAAASNADWIGLYAGDSTLKERRLFYKHVPAGAATGVMTISSKATVAGGLYTMAYHRGKSDAIVATVRMTLTGSLTAPPVTAEAYAAGVEGSPASNVAVSTIGRNAWCPTARDVSTVFDPISRTLQVSVRGTHLDGVTEIRFRGGMGSYRPVYQSETELRIWLFSAPSTGKDRLKGTNILRLISHFGEAKVPVNLDKVGKDLPTKCPTEGSHLKNAAAAPLPVQVAREPCVHLGFSERGFNNLLDAFFAALSNRRLTEILLGTYLLSDSFQENLAEAGDVEMSISLFELDHLVLPAPKLRLNAETSELSVELSGVGLTATLAFARLKLSEFFTYTDVGARVTMGNIHGKLVVDLTRPLFSRNPLQRDADGAATGDKDEDGVCKLNLDFDSLDLALSLDIERGGISLARQANWGYAGKLAESVSSYFKGLLSWLLSSNSLAVFLARELNRALGNSASLGRISRNGLTVEHALVGRPAIRAAGEGGGALWTVHSGRVFIRGKEDDPLYAAIPAPQSVDHVIEAMAHTGDLVVVLCPYLVNTALVSVFLSGLLNISVTRKELPPELRLFAEAGIFSTYGIGAADDFTLQIRALEPPFIKFDTGSATCACKSDFSLLNAKGKVVFHCDLSFNTNLSAADLSFTATGLHGLEKLKLDNAGAAMLAASIERAGTQIAAFITKLYATQIVPQMSATLGGTEFLDMPLVRKLNATETTRPIISIAPECITVSVLVPAVAAAAGEVDALAEHLLTKMTIPNDPASRRQALDRSLAWIEKRILLHTRPATPRVAASPLDSIIV